MPESSFGRNLRVAMLLNEHAFTWAAQTLNLPGISLIGGYLIKEVLITDQRESSVQKLIDNTARHFDVDKAVVIDQFDLLIACDGYLTTEDGQFLVCDSANMKHLLEVAVSHVAEAMRDEAVDQPDPRRRIGSGATGLPERAQEGGAQLLR